MTCRMSSAAIEKRATKKDQVLALLSDYRPHGMRELNRITFRYGARIWELNREGYEIETIRCGVDEFEYRLIPQEKQLELV